MESKCYSVGREIKKLRAENALLGSAAYFSIELLEDYFADHGEDGDYYLRKGLAEIKRLVESSKTPPHAALTPTPDPKGSGT